MKRLEIIACEAIQVELIEAIEKVVKDFEYTLMPRIEGKGLRTRKQGTQVWPELNFMLVSYLEDEEGLERASAAIAATAARFPKEGVFAAVSEARRIK
ncbi:MAG TPA: hypothetical protein PLB91_03180 [Spirochaetales bacterium]|nr:hypothetical protein [Spirochaetales bacterium]HRY53545.1 hypothetical protein [Spirochaetia bacterium]HRZ63366.1 hypothetical protein [Spirochaetia bacterium]